MKPWLPNNAASLVKARQLGFSPDGPVVVSLVGGSYHDIAETALFASPEMPTDRIDWRMLVNLEVWLWASPKAALDWVLQTALRIAHAQPRRLVLRFEDDLCQLHNVDVGTGYHARAIRDLSATHAFVWDPTNLSDTVLAAKLRAALLSVMPAWSTL